MCKCKWSPQIKIDCYRKSKKPRCLKDVNMNKFRINYLQQQNGWMDVGRFTKWFNDVFVSAVKKIKAENTGPSAIVTIGQCPYTSSSLMILM